MLASRESIAEFIKTKVASELTGITDPEMRFAVRSIVQPPEFPNCVNLYFFDDPVATSNPMYPHWRKLNASLDVLVQLDPDNPLLAEKQILTIIPKINGFMKDQVIPKLDYSSGSPGTFMGTYITWRDSYPMKWNSGQALDDRYIQRSALITFRYFEEKN